MFHHLDVESFCQICSQSQCIMLCFRMVCNNVIYVVDAEGRVNVCMCVYVYGDVM